jgi:2-dehydro-3-deoxyphosphogluconate aldolase/(4S)-4-hydroxy-2-oxoglutarate aldolase
MGKHKIIIERIKSQGLIPLFYHEDIEVSKAVVRALYEAGIRIIEYTNRGENALNNFKTLLKLRDKQWPDLLLAIGTIKNVKDAKAYIKAKADFIICPGVIKEVGEKVLEANLLWLPGCTTPTEIMLAEDCGAKLVKLFPGNLLGPGFVTAIKEIFPGIDFMPTGGVEINKENIESWFKAGVCAVGMGSKLITKTALEKKEYTKITSLTKEVLDIIQQVK